MTPVFNIANSVPCFERLFFQQLLGFSGILATANYVI